MDTSRMSEIDDATVAAAQAGDREAVGRMLADVERIIVFKVGRIVVRDRRDDCAQDVRLQVLRAIERFTASRSSWRTYIGHCVGYMITDYCRADHAAGQYSRVFGLRARSVQLSTFEGIGDDDQSANSVEPAYYDDDCYDTVELLDTLEASPQMRALGLYLRGWSMAEVGKRMGICESAVSQQIKRIKSDQCLVRRIAVLAGLHCEAATARVTRRKQA